MTGRPQLARHASHHQPNPPPEVHSTTPTLTMMMMLMLIMITSLAVIRYHLIAAFRGRNATTLTQYIFTHSLHTVCMLAPCARDRPRLAATYVNTLFFFPYHRHGPELTQPPNSSIWGTAQGQAFRCVKKSTPTTPSTLRIAQLGTSNNLHLHSKAQIVGSRSSPAPFCLRPDPASLVQ